MLPPLIDTHAHLYLAEFDSDRKEVIENAVRQGVRRIFLPNIDSNSLAGMMEMAEQYPGFCYPMMGLHPTSVKEDYGEQMDVVREALASGRHFGIGETGIDLYRDKTYADLQCRVFEEHIRLALQYDLPVIIHARNSFNEILEILQLYRNSKLTGIFHAYTGNLAIAEQVTDMGFMLGIGGIVTFGKTGLEEVVRHTDLSHLVLETDSPYLAPVPMRGKRNESSYIRYVAETVASIRGTTLLDVAGATTKNALGVFKKAQHGE